MQTRVAPPGFKEENVTKPPSRASVREQKAEALDTFVKAELVRKKELNAAKTERLKALRLARDEQEAKTAAARPPAVDRTVTRKTMHLRRSS